MKRYIIVAVAAILASAFTSSAQTTDKKFHRYNRWMAGGQISYNTNCLPGIGAEAIYGRQFSETVFLGVGFGGDMYVSKEPGRSMTTTYPDGTQDIKIFHPYKYDFLVPVYADLQVNLSSKRSPFFAEFKLGAALDVALERISGTKRYNEWDLWGGGVLFGAAIGKRFALRNDSGIDLTLGLDNILWPWYINAPVSLGVRYCF